MGHGRHVDETRGGPRLGSSGIHVPYGTAKAGGADQGSTSVCDAISRCSTVAAVSCYPGASTVSCHGGVATVSEGVGDWLIRRAVHQAHAHEETGRDSNQDLAKRGLFHSASLAEFPQIPQPATGPGL
jgi:hypothetical protein